MAVVGLSTCRNCKLGVFTFQLTIKCRKITSVDCGARSCIALWLEAEATGAHEGAGAASKDRKNQQTLCPEGEAQHCLKNTAPINSNQSEFTYPARAGIIRALRASLAGQWGAEWVDRGWALNPFTRAARSRWIQGWGFRTATPEIKLKRWLKTCEWWLFHGHASLPAFLPRPTDYSPTGQILTAILTPVHDATREPDTPTAWHMLLFLLLFRWARQTEHCDGGVW